MRDVSLLIPFTGWAGWLVAILAIAGSCVAACFVAAYHVARWLRRFRLVPGRTQFVATVCVRQRPTWKDNPR